MADQTKPYTLREAAKATGVSYHHLWRLCKAKELPHTRLGRKILIPSRVVRAILEGNEVNS